MLGGLEIIVVFFIALLLFGPKKIPEIARTLGEAVREFRKASNPIPVEAKTVRKDDELLTKVAKELGVEVEGKGREELAKAIIEKARRKIGEKS
ncbi:MAG: twin-arginine translocase TatA/TatE family subunit [Thermoprotei archaeon]|nr:MAG: twin-arginine translocase TatA/TatE family subunit [Thermoprotei archaeon]